MPDEITLRVDRQVGESVLRKLEALGYSDDGHRAAQFVEQLRAALAPPDRAELSPEDARKALEREFQQQIDGARGPK